MIRYTSQHQLSITDFKTPFEQNLLPTNRWVILSRVIPWDELAKVYHRQMSADFGRGSVDTRLVIGVLIIKHLLKLDDREVLATLQENLYLQYFVGYSSFQTKIAFDPSLLVTLRKRMGITAFDEWSLSVIAKIEAIQAAQLENQAPPKDIEKEDNTKANKTPNEPVNNDKKDNKIAETEKPIALKDTLIIDTTVAEQKIKYPTDIDLLNNVRELTEDLIDIFYESSPLKVKPRTYRKIARKDYLNAALKRKKSHKEIRKAIKNQLRYVERNIHIINMLWDILIENSIPIPFAKPTSKALYNLYKKWLVCQEIYRQQKEMIDAQVKSCQHRIVSIDQPHVRPILRGKDAKKIEFGAKVALSVVNGTNRIFRISWDAYNDGIDLIGQVEAFKKQYNQYPKLVLADKIYMTKANRAYLKVHNIQHRGKPLGRPKKDKNGNNLEPFTLIQQQEANQRNHVEGQFGTAKDAYDLNKVKAKTAPTSESWIANIFFIMNIIKLLKVAQTAMSVFARSFLKTIKMTILSIFRPPICLRNYQGA